MFDKEINRINRCTTKCKICCLVCIIIGIFGAGHVYTYHDRNVELLVGCCFATLIICSIIYAFSIATLDDLKLFNNTPTRALLLGNTLFAVKLDDSDWQYLHSLWFVKDGCAYMVDVNSRCITLPDSVEMSSVFD